MLYTQPNLLAAIEHHIKQQTEPQITPDYKFWSAHMFFQVTINLNQTRVLEKVHVHTLKPSCQAAPHLRLSSLELN